MKTLISRLKSAVIQLQIQRIDRRYIQMNRTIEWYENALHENKEAAHQVRSALLLQRRKLRTKLLKMEGC